MFRLKYKNPSAGEIKTPNDYANDKPLFVLIYAI
jgi:hypothetical protein